MSVGKIHLCLVKKQQKAFAKRPCELVCARHKLSHLILVTALTDMFSYSWVICGEIGAHVRIEVTCPK